jgi:hypothetical protein
VTIRPPEYLRFSELMHPVLESIGPNYRARLEEPLYLFTPHPTEPSHMQYAGGEMTYGETVITLPYIRVHWSRMFELLDIDLLIDDRHQVVITLRRR